MPADKQKTLLLVANWDSDVGYAWWLMESFWATIAKRYSKANRIVLAYPTISKIPTSILEAPLQPVQQPFGLSLSPKQLLSELQFLRKNNVRCIYLSDRPTWSLRYALYRLAGVILIVTHDHTPGLRSAPKGIKRLIKQMLQRTPWITADGLIGASDFVRDRMMTVDCAPPSRCHAAPNGLPQPAHSDSGKRTLREQFGIPPERSVMVMVARANPFKNIEFALQCTAELKRNGHEVHFLLCGDGPHLQPLKDMAKQLQISELVTFAGRRDDVPSLLPQCTLAIHPSRGEVGYSLSILEYMQASLPMVVPDNPSVCGATLNGITGITYPEDDLHAACAGIRQLIDNPDKAQEMGNAANKLVDEKYLLQHTHSALIKAFEVIDKNRLLDNAQ